MKPKMRQKTLNTRQMRQMLEDTLQGLSAFANGVAADFERVGQHQQATREFLADLSVRVDQLSARLDRLDMPVVTSLREHLLRPIQGSDELLQYLLAKRAEDETLAQLPGAPK